MGANFSTTDIIAMAKRNPSLFEDNPSLLTDEVRALLPRTPEETAELVAKSAEVAEKVLQGQVESFLRRQGFYPRTHEWIRQVASPTRRGWYGHWSETRRNPIVLDLLVWVDQGPCTEFELKVAGGHVREDQEYISTAGNPVLWSYQAAVKHVSEWLVRNKMEVVVDV